MKKHNFYFIGECAIIIALLILIGIVARDEKKMVQGKESVTSVVEAETSALLEVSETEMLKLEKENTLSGDAILENQDDVVDNDIVDASISGNEVVVASVSESDITVSAITSNEAEQISTSENTCLDAKEEDKVKIVVFGDSIWNAGRGEDGISERVMEQLKVEIYNCAIGGTTAAVDGESTDLSSWTSNSFNGMMYIARGKADGSEIIPDDKAYEVLQTVDFNEVDYVIVSYGLNDYFSDIPVYPKHYFDMTSYIGALRHGIHKLGKDYPNIEFILTSPTYCGWFKGERQYELGTYVEAARSVAQQMELHFLDMYHALGKNPDEKTEYLSDGVHLNEEGRRLYAHSIVEYLKELGVKEIE